LGLLLCPVGCNKPVEVAAQPVPANPAAGQPAAGEFDELRTSALYIDRCLERMEGEARAGTLLQDRATSIITSAERTLPVFWGTAPESLPPDLRAKTDAYPQRIRGWIDRINELRSQEQLAVARREWDGFAAWHHLNQHNPWQVRIDKNAEVQVRIAKAVGGMTPGPAADAASAVLADCQRHLNQLGRGQLTAYNRWALARCHQFATFCLTNTVISDGTLNDEFDKSGMIDIDVGLLSAEARRVYEIAVGFMDAKLKERRRAEFLLKLTEARKWQLAEF
jgi:hypothetical protein